MCFDVNVCIDKDEDRDWCVYILRSSNGVKPRA